MPDPSTYRPKAGSIPTQPGVYRFRDPTDRVIYELQDGRIDLKRVQQAIQAATGRIDQRFDARLAETLYPGRVARRTELLIEVARRGIKLPRLNKHANPIPPAHP